VFSAELPNNATAKAYNGLPDDNIVTGSTGPASGNPQQPETVTIKVMVRGANGTISVMIFTIERVPGRQSMLTPDGDWQRQPWTAGSRLAASVAIDRDHAALADLDDWLRTDGTNSGAGEPNPLDGPPAGRPGLSQQLAGIGWRAMHAERQALLDSLNRRL
jgi:hypothetical protein